MSDRLTEIERLQALRANGTLSDEEFERAKANLLDQDKPTNRLPSWWVAGAGVAGLALAIFLVKPMLAASGDATAPVISAPESEGWSISEQKDPMTDVTSATAVKAFVGAAADIEVTISCASTGQVSYQLASFGKDRKPMEMRSHIGGYDTNPWLTIPFEMRVDDQPPVSESTINPTYNNVVSLRTPGPGSAEVSNADKAAGARRVTFALHLAHSDETLVVDQTGQAISALLQPCVERRAQQVRQAAAQAQQQEAEGQRQRQAEPAHPAEAM